VPVHDDRAEQVGRGGGDRVAHRHDDEQERVVGRLQVEAVGGVVVDLGGVVGEEQPRMGDDELDVAAAVEAAQDRERAELVADPDEDEPAGVGEARQAAGEVQLGELVCRCHRRKSITKRRIQPSKPCSMARPTASWRFFAPSFS
jgi:hypothetical protein